MRVFVYEYTCATGNAPSLQVEGWAMLAAVTEDLSRVPGVQVITLLGPRCPAPANCRVFRWTNEAQQFRELAAAADYSLIIAPECDGLLLERNRWVIEAGGRLLGPLPEAVELTGDKLFLGWFLSRLGIPTPPSRPYTQDPGWTFPIICKPRFGAGSQATFLIHSHETLREVVSAARAEGHVGQLIVQPFVPGLAASAACLMGPGHCLPLPPAEQRLSADGRFHYLGGSLPLAPALATRATQLAMRALTAVPGLQGYVGIDLVLGHDGQDWVIEINSRLTTSYVGLRALADFNLASAWLQIVRGREIPRPDWKPNYVRFRADGQLWVSPLGPAGIRQPE